MSLIKTRGKSFIIVCDNCGNYRRLESKPEVDEDGGEVANIPPIWTAKSKGQYHCSECTLAVQEALEARRGSTTR